MKKEKGISLVAAIILIVLAVIVLAVGIFLTYKIVKSTQEILKNSNTESVTENKDDNSNVTTQTNKKQVVVGGFKITIPEEYECTIGDQGLLIYDEDRSWTMLFAVRDGSYSSKMQEPEVLMSGAINSGGNIKNSITETTINSKQYAYFTYEKNNINYVVAYTSANQEKRFGIQVETDQNYATILSVFDRLASSAVETNEPDTTQEDIDKMNRILPGEVKENGTLTLNDTTVKYSIPSNFYSTGVDSYIENATKESFTTEEFKVYAYYELTSEFYYNSIEEYLNNVSNPSNDVKNVKKSDIQKINVSGKEIKYITVQYQKDYNGEIRTFKELYAIYELPNNYVLQFYADTLDDKQELNIDTVKGFFNIT